MGNPNPTLLAAGSLMEKVIGANNNRPPKFPKPLRKTSGKTIFLVNGEEVFPIQVLSLTQGRLAGSSALLVGFSPPEKKPRIVGKTKACNTVILARKPLNGEADHFVDKSQVNVFELLSAAEGDLGTYNLRPTGEVRPFVQI